MSLKTFVDAFSQDRGVLAEKKSSFTSLLQVTFTVRDS